MNLGVGSAAVQGSIHRNYRKTPQWKAALDSDIDVAIVQLGTNDARTQLWDELRFREDYVDMLQQLRQRHPKAVVITSVPPPVVWPSKLLDPKLASESVPQAIRDARLNAGERVAPIDMRWEFARHGRAKGRETARTARRGKLLHGDGIHPNAAGHRAMAEAAAAA